MAYKSITLSDGLPCRVRQLGLFELNGKGFTEIIGPYRYSLLLATGQVVEDEYDIRALDEIPKPPGQVEGIVPNSPEWYQLNEYETYLAAVAHEKRRVESYHGYADDVITYILTNCVKDEDHSRITTPGDWKAVYQAVLVPELTYEEVAGTLKTVFQGFLWWSGDIRRNYRHLQRSGAGGGAGPVGA